MMLRTLLIFAVNVVPGGEEGILDIACSAFGLTGSNPSQGQKALMQSGGEEGILDIACSAFGLTGSNPSQGP